MDETLYEKFLNASFRFVSYRPRSEKEIRDFLTRKLKAWKTVGQYSVDKVLARLKEYGYIDDAKFAAWWVDQRSTFRPKGKALIARELAAHGVPRESIDLEPYNELEQAKTLVAKKRAVWAKLPPLEQKKKLFGFLGRRGFSLSTINSIVDAEVGKSYNTGEEKERI